MQAIHKNKSQGIYLDYAATTPASDRVLGEIQNYYRENFGNPSAMHLLGQKAQSALDEARSAVAEILGVSWQEIYFLPSATETINLVLRGYFNFHKKDIDAPHIITTNIEHSAVINTCRALEEEGARVTYLPVDKEGLVTAEQVKNALSRDTILVSIMYVNNEIGTVQPIREIASTIAEYKKETGDDKLKFHIDAVQATNYLDINAKNLGVDMMTLSGHKIYSVKGASVLYKNEKTTLEPIVTGGGQERGLHSGTENVPAIMAFAEALRETEEIKDEETERITVLRDKFINEVLDGTDKVLLNGSHSRRVPNNVNFCFKEKSSEALIPAFDAEDIYVSGGSACASRVPEPSHVISAIGREEFAKNAIRFTLGRQTKENDIERAIDITIKIANE